MRAAALTALMLAAPAWAARRKVPFAVPEPSSIPAGAAGDEVRLGMDLVARTPALLPDHAPGRLACASCHRQSGRKAFAIPFVGLSGLYPTPLERAGRAVTLAERVNDCFRRSLNGRPLDEGSREMRAILAYIAWLSSSIPAGAEPEGRGTAPLAAARPPDPKRGKAVYERRCARCHGRDGAGRDDGAGGIQYPALWGRGSFNLGASMARTSKAAAFVRRNMPQDDPGGLSDLESWDVAEYFTHRPRPDFPGRAADWPKGGRPADAR